MAIYVCAEELQTDAAAVYKSVNGLIVKNNICVCLEHDAVYGEEILLLQLVNCVSRSSFSPKENDEISASEAFYLLSCLRGEWIIPRALSRFKC